MAPSVSSKRRTKREFAHSEGLSEFEAGTDRAKYESLERQSYRNVEEFSADLGLGRGQRWDFGRVGDSHWVGPKKSWETFMEFFPREGSWFPSALDSLHTGGEKGDPVSTFARESRLLQRLSIVFRIADVA